MRSVSSSTTPVTWLAPSAPSLVPSTCPESSICRLSLPGPLASLPSSLVHSLIAPALTSTAATLAWYSPENPPENQGLARGAAVGALLGTATGAAADALGFGWLPGLLQPIAPNSAQ